MLAKDVDSKVLCYSIAKKSNQNCKSETTYGEFDHIKTTLIQKLITFDQFLDTSTIQL